MKAVITIALATSFFFTSSSFFVNALPTVENIDSELPTTMTSQHNDSDTSFPMQYPQQDNITQLSPLKLSKYYLSPLSTEPPSSDMFPSIEHPYPPIYADPMFNKVVPTCSWISNLFYPSVKNLAPTTPDPYILRYLDDFNGPPGLSISQPFEKVVGSYPAVNNVPPTKAGYMINGVVVDFRISATEWKTNRPEQIVTYWDHFGANLRLYNSDNDITKSSSSSIDFPIARGAPFITSKYTNLTPQFFTQHAIINIVAEKDLGSDTYSGRKFKVSMNDSPTSTYIIYVLGSQPITLKKTGFSNLVAEAPFTGVIQVAKLPKPENEALLDSSIGTWATGASIDTGSDSTSYTIRWNVDGDHSKPLLAYAYPHHLKSLVNDGHIKKTSLILQSASKGSMQALVGNSWTLKESDMPKTEWLPSQPRAESSTQNEIMEAMVADVYSNYTEGTQKGDNYFSGKGLQKYAMLALLLNKPDETEFRNPELAQVSLDKLKKALVPYLENKQEDPLRYDVVYRGLVALHGLPEDMGGTGNKDAEFGHSYYNDHHYHQGYLVVTAAIVHHLDPTWRTQELKDWTEALIRDVNNPNEDDPYFAQFRNWDWFSGHSWAGGIKIDGALDGRDQESVPESVNFYWGMKLWGLATNNQNAVDLANLQLALTKRTTYEYFWMMDDNQNRPKEMVKNKVVGIYFEQKADYTTYFGRYVEFIHGIQQLPMTPILAEYIRTPEFVTEEWDQKLSAVAPTVKTPWAGVLYLNYALIDPAAAYPILRTSMVDDGQTRSYSLYIAATRPGFYRRSYSKFLREKKTHQEIPEIEENKSRA